MIRTSAAGDCLRAYQLICDMESHALPYPAFEAIYQAQLASSRHLGLVWEEEGVCAGFLHLRWEDQLHHAGRVAEIMELVVDPSLRGRGVGAQLLEAAGKAAKDAGCLQLEVACNQLRRDTHRFYQRCGMKNYHYKFTMDLTGAPAGENAIGR